MATPRLTVHGGEIAYAASGAINLELSPKPGTITRLGLVVRADVTTTTATNLNDYWDRVIANLSLSGKGKTYFSYSNMRAAYHHSRMKLGNRAPKRPTVIADSATNSLQQFAYLFHFGVAPLRYNPATGGIEDNPFDLTGGIPPAEAGNLTLSGAFGAAAAPGTNVTVNDADIDVYVWMVQKDGGESEMLYLPKAIPIWSMQTPTPTATSTPFASSFDVPTGNFLRSMLIMTTNGTGAPRDDAVLTSLQLFFEKEAREIIRLGGQADAVARYKAAELLLQPLYLGNGWPPSDNNSTLGVPAVPQVADEGLVPLPVHHFVNPAKGGDPVYGLDLRNVNTGDLKLKWGVADATGVTLDVVFEKYEKLLAA